RWEIAGSPNFRNGSTYFLCLEKKPTAVDGKPIWITKMLSYGILKEIRGNDGSPLLIPLEDGMHLEEAMPRLDGAIAEPIGPYGRDELIGHLSASLGGTTVWNSDVVELDASRLPATGGGGAPPGICSYFTDGAGRNFRWRAFDNGGTATMFADSRGDLSLPGGGFQEIVNCMDAWMDVPTTGLNLVFGGPRTLSINCSGGQDTQADTIVLNDPCSDIGDLQGCGGVLAFGGPRTGGTHTFDGASWITINGWIVVANNGVGCLGSRNWTIMMTHELGHGLGFGHVEDNRALMAPSCCNTVNATDRTCVSYTYPKKNENNDRPDVDAGPDATLTLARNSARVVGTASDDAAAALGTTWRQLGGPGAVTFEDPTALDTIASFSQSGEYLLGLTASDGELVRTDIKNADVQIFVGTQTSDSFQQGVAGYNGTRDTVLEESDQDANNANSSDLFVDADDGNTGLGTQALLRFDEIIGSDDGQISEGTAIQSARLELTTTNQGDGAEVYRMLGTWAENDSWDSFGNGGISVGVDTPNDSDATVTGVGEVVTVDVTESLRAWIDEPSTNHGWAFLPRGDDGWDFDSSEGDTPPRLVVEYQSTESVTLVAVGDEWDYRDGRTAPRPGWNEIEFETNDEWRSGPSGFGYGDGDDATVIDDMRDNYLTLYTRKEFEVPNASVIGRLVLRVDYDDGFVAYLNGDEVARSSTMGAPGSPVGPGTEAGLREAGQSEDYLIDASLLRTGTNVLAIELHNGSVDSSDASLIPSLSATYIVLDEGQEWRFARGRVSPGANWVAVDFDDSAWETGPVGIGYGDGDDLTILDDMEDSYVSVFLRRNFTLPDLPGTKEYLFTAIIDDGFVVYVNGVEAGRFGMPQGAISHTTPASSSREPEPVTIRIPASRFVDGNNLVAVSVHNASLGSSDLSFVPILIPVRDSSEPPPPPPPPPADTFQRGDASADGLVNLSDAVVILNYLFIGGEDFPCFDGADGDDNGQITLTDAVRVLNFLFLGAEPPSAPGLDCGEDPTEDELVCESTCSV
ncbi:MAG: DNRLRE domain-containing protein, partial [Planctomycetota bacterium]